MIRIRLATSLVPLLATAWLLASLEARTQTETGSRFPLPMRVEGWVNAGDEEFDEELLRQIEPDAYAIRIYRAAGRTPVWVYVGMYGGRAGHAKGAHDPAICYPAQGWEAVRSSSVAVEQGEARLHTKLLHVQRREQEQAVLYWFQPADRWPAQGVVEQLLQVLDAVRGHPQYAFVRLSGPRDGSGRAEADLIEFASAVAPAIRGEVERF